MGTLRNCQYASSRLYKSPSRLSRHSLLLTRRKPSLTVLGNVAEKRLSSLGPSLASQDDENSKQKRSNDNLRGKESMSTFWQLPPAEMRRVVVDGFVPGMFNRKDELYYSTRCLATIAMNTGSLNEGSKFAADNTVPQNEAVQEAAGEELAVARLRDETMAALQQILLEKEKDTDSFLDDNNIGARSQKIQELEGLLKRWKQAWDDNSIANPADARVARYSRSCGAEPALCPGT